MNTSPLMKNDMLSSDIVCIDDFIYSFSSRYGFLERTDLSTMVSEIIYEPEGDLQVEHLIRVDRKLFAIEADLKKLWVFDIDTKKMVFYIIDMGENKWGDLIDFFAYDGKVFIFSSCKKEYVEFDITSKNIQKYPVNIITGPIMRGIHLDDSFYIFENNSNSYQKIDLKKRNGSINKLQIVIDNLVNVYECKKNIYILSRDGDVFSYDIEENLISKIIDKCEFKTKFSRIVVASKVIIMLPLTKNDDMYIYNIKDASIQKYTNYPSDFAYDEDQEWGAYVGADIIKGRMVFACRVSNYYLSIDLADGDIQWIKNNSCLLEKKIHKIMQKRIDDSKIIYENKELNVNNFIKYNIRL